MYDIDLSQEDEQEDEQDDDTALSKSFMESEHLVEIASVFENTLTETVDTNHLEKIENNPAIKDLIEKNEMFVKQSEDSKTSRLWIMYLEMVEIFCTFIKAERTGNWFLHLKTLSEMLPYFAASGHYPYLKSTYCYLQAMQNLPSSHPNVYERFKEGYNIVRMYDKFWAGLGTDLIIEQELMCSLKSTGGLTRGRGMTELQRVKWLLSTTTCAGVKQIMQDFTGVNYESSEQHKDQNKEVSMTRCSRDYKDACRIIRYMEARNPFQGHPGVVCLETGEIADETVDAFNAKEIGNCIISKMVGQPMMTYSFTKKDMAITMKPRSSIVIDGEIVPIDPQLLFQRLLIMAGRDDIQLRYALSYELCTIPAALFGKDGLMREANKPALGEEIWKRLNNDDVQVSQNNSKHVLDGGYLIHKLKWHKGETFKDIFKKYNDYVINNYGQGTVVVFDGYPHAPSTKDSTHLRRRASKSARSVSISPFMKLNVSKDVFLSVLQNKSYLLNDEGDVTAIQAESDADLLVVQTAVELSEEYNIIVIAEDTDILVLLIHHADLKRNSTFLTCEQKVTCKRKPKIWDIYETNRVLGIDVCSNILALHAFSGCDTTSRLHGVGKGECLKKLIENAEFKRHLHKFNDSLVSPEEIAESGEKLIFLLYGGKQEENLEDLRYSLFCKKIARSKTAVFPENLPPTTDAAKYHSYRVFHQVQAWKGVNLDPKDWGLIVKGKLLLPIGTKRPPAPDELLKLIKCNCNTDCSSYRCSCRKHGLKCSRMCGSCNGVSCTNGEEIDFEE